MSAGGVLAPRSGGHGWQLILADLALILFLVTLSALPAAGAGAGRIRSDAAARDEEAAPVRPAPEVAAAQALYRPVAGGPGLGTWLAGQPRDPRATLTVFARHRPGGEAAAWAGARRLSAEARARGVTVRTIIAPGGTTELYASLAYDGEPSSP
ncbi:MAG: hypothetical protein GC147_04905 [Porphyrobacter sp.]|nr:hypothetical protein [Porphyrobacter sp.]